MTIKERLHHIIEELPDGDLVTAERVLAALVDTAEQVHEWHMDEAPEDDEPETPEESAAIEAAKARMAAGDPGIPHEEIRRRVFGVHGP